MSSANAAPHCRTLSLLALRFVALRSPAGFHKGQTPFGSGSGVEPGTQQQTEHLSLSRTLTLSEAQVSDASEAHLTPRPWTQNIGLVGGSDMVGVEAVKEVSIRGTSLGIFQASSHIRYWFVPYSLVTDRPRCIRVN
ncbi:hypothetical protein B0H14DRAFT_2620659 [Mycena olivaceomarginata]|nr:hypothetical protein B0H14DRAFT_2620659 [Mycena olivaceomarginata]